MMQTATTTATVDRASPKKPDQNDFFWTYTEEPHRTRRMAIIKAHPEVIASSLASLDCRRLLTFAGRSPSSAGQSH